MSVRKRFFQRIYFTKKLPFIRLRSNKRASLILVKDRFNDCKTEAEKLLYQKLFSELYYPTPRMYVGGIQINIALVPYRLAFVEACSKEKEKRIIKQLRKKRWHVLFYDPAQITNADLCDEYLAKQSKLPAIYGLVRF
ncbi:hypothetical protein AJ85_21670 [Alkalihalobacillus alcalophilus ATCC 27647 = CGMCC 1.3604]|uniref:Uncharacterized protein n=1 Tax=Alkalihalobacillus alcalophilus ATCC 27647 = CGMCC 1.3604 TaxID=1218173 RepID=A0A094WPZ5_ALKAL|nr:hypothetical protein [Alkalihalobacillus alcalophilus]KGA98108.1 hypothetical protein BALCAV_0206155 [Alkalihalobacillus alcalophilus ATCC 27647 = CGMCC 1.3604]MED1561445.1 hypothetical protein [Alkalihalobacillus alcalophilus]THG88781.1 hypothetical protein AJ85_21670 [Alkalihalobacillus alcalophilus ATCC 27647 = CGMCC 1.3604]